MSLFLFVEKQTLQFGGRQIKSCRADTDTPQAKPIPNVIKPSGFLLPLLLRAKIYTRAENNHHFFFRTNHYFSITQLAEREEVYSSVNNCILGFFFYLKNSFLSFFKSYLQENG